MEINQTLSIGILFIGLGILFWGLGTFFRGLAKFMQVDSGHGIFKRR